MSILQNIAAFVAGAIVGSVINMALITVGPSVIPPPEGVDVMNAESLAANIHLFETRHFVFPFLAHALGAFFGALAGFLLAGRRKHIVAWAVGALSLAGGIAASTMIPAPAPFIAVDLIFAYLPMAWLAVRTGRALAGGTSAPTEVAG
jgi:hypothetical protein